VGLGQGIRRHAGRWPVIGVFPQAPPEHRWHGKVAHLALATLDHTLQEFSTDADRVYLAGISAGGNGVWTLAYRHPRALRRAGGGLRLGGAHGGAP
jgi:poly(3-hydroxybutyrate) depolymerase